MEATTHRKILPSAANQYSDMRTVAVFSIVFDKKFQLNRLFGYILKFNMNNAQMRLCFANR